MIYFCADDYGLNSQSSEHIEKCIKEGILNKVSVFPNFDTVDFDKLKDVRLSLHLNLVEGKCIAEDKFSLLTDENGNFKHTFGGLLKMSLLKKKAFEDELYKEIKAQVLYWKNSNSLPFCIDSHQHTHMIPLVFKVLTKVLREEKIQVEYIRIPAEPLLPFLKTPSLYFTYSPVNVIKQWLINFFWLINKKDFSFPTAYFFGILFSGKMDEKRVKKVLPHYISLAKKHNKDIEVLFHPGFLTENVFAKNVKFQNFYLSENRKTEFDSAMNMKEGFL